MNPYLMHTCDFLLELLLCEKRKEKISDTSALLNRFLSYLKQLNGQLVLIDHFFICYMAASCTAAIYFFYACIISRVMGCPQFLIIRPSQLRNAQEFKFLYHCPVVSSYH